jgi:tetratricopeptide (TPR) repeat protein
MTESFLKVIVLILALLNGMVWQSSLGVFAENDSLKSLEENYIKSSTSSSSKPTLRLQGKAEVLQPLSTNLVAWQASQAYRAGVAALSLKDFNLAAEYFKQAGDGFANASDQGKFLAESRFAEGQARKLLKQNAEATKLFAAAVELFRQFDPESRYLKAALAQLNQPQTTKPLTGRATKIEAKLQQLPAMMDAVDKNVVLKGKLIQLDDGTKIASLKDDELFNGGSKRLLSQAAAVDVSDAFVHKTIYKAFLKMNCLEFSDLGGNYYTAPDSYKSIKADGKTVIIGASNDFWVPVLKLKINGRQYGISMDLPGMSKYTRNVVVVTDGQHVLAIDPKSSDTWKLVATSIGRVSSFGWSKLTHIKKRTV